MTNEKTIMCLEDMKIKVPIPKAAKQARENNEALDVAINALQSAEPQIIRCKDCKNWDTTWTNDFSPNYHYCPMVDGVRKEDWFCADAERRTDE